MISYTNSLRTQIKELEVKRDVQAGPKLHKFGIEKTFVSHEWGQGTKRIDNRLHSKHQKIAKAIKRELPFEVHDCGTDPGCVEVASKPMTSIKEAKHFFEVTSELAKKHGLRHTSPTIYGCGGHIHVEAPKNEDHQKALYAFAEMHPWINAFGNPEDDINLYSPAYVNATGLCEHLLDRDWDTKGEDMQFYLGSSYEEMKQSYYGGALDVKTLREFAANLEFVLLHNRSGDGHMQYELQDMLEHLKPNIHKKDLGCLTITPRAYMGTFEFRAFESASTWKEQKAHIDFVQAVVKYTGNNKKWILEHKPTLLEMVEMTMIPEDDQVKMFEKMFGLLGLDLGPYVRYIPRLRKRINMEQKSLTKKLSLVKLDF